MTFMRSQYRILPTSLGPVLMWSNGQRTEEDGRKLDVIGIRTEHDHNLPIHGANGTDEPGKGDVVSSVRINRVDWHAHTVAYVDSDTLRLARWGDIGDDVRRPLGDREPSWESKMKATAKWRDVIDEALAEFLASPDALAFLALGRIAQSNNDADRAEAEVEKARQALDEASERLRRAEIDRAASVAQLVQEDFRAYTGNRELTDDDVDLTVWREALREKYDALGIATPE